jgi:flagellar biosynthetic protein FlhB
MADQDTGEKTEDASAQKLRKARDKGQVARSKDMATAVGIVCSLQLIVVMAPSYLEDFRHLFGLGFVMLDGEAALDNMWSNAFKPAILLVGKMVLPLAIIPILIAAFTLFPGGWVFSADQFMPKLERLNPFSYFSRITKPKHLIDWATTAAKAACLIAVLWHVASASRPSYLRLQGLPLNEALAQAMGMAITGIFTLCMVFVVFALVDLPVQRFVFLRDQRMSKRDQKEEHKTSEGRPEVRQRIRQLQQQIAKRSVRKIVPTADVVIVNPTHYAVALKYDTLKAEAPYVIAKGVDEMALYIRSLATEHNIEVLELPPLARAIYNTSQVKQQIPAALYQAVALVLRYVLQLRAYRQGGRKAQPTLPSDLHVPANLT